MMHAYDLIVFRSCYLHDHFLTKNACKYCNLWSSKAPFGLSQECCGSSGIRFTLKLLSLLAAPKNACTVGVIGHHNAGPYTYHAYLKCA